MYYDYFGFKQPPFRITPDTKLFYSGGDRGAILDALLYAILNGEGIVKVVGEVGSGKTMLCRMLEKELPENVEVVYLVNPSIAPENTLHAIAFELKLDVRPDTSRFEVMNRLQQYLLQRHSENRQVVVFVEEAQSMPIATLEEIRLLSNLETQQSKLLQIVLFGQPELDQMIARPEIRQLKERITYSFQLSPFKTNDIREYINTRIRACGYRAGELFEDAAIRQIEQHSKGLLRRINILADKALLAAFAENTHKVRGKHTRLAARDSEFIPATRRFRPAIITAVVTLTALVALAGYYFYERAFPPPVPDVSLQPDTPDEPAPSAADPDTTPQGGSVQETPDPVSEDESKLVFFENLGGSVDRSAEIAEDSVGVTDISVPVVDSVRPDTEMDSYTNAGEESASAQQTGTDTPEQVGSGDEPRPDIEENQENQLLGLSSVVPMLDFSDAGLTDAEVEQLRDQLVKLPPESSEFMSLEKDTCEQCWSIIYRPVWGVEKL